MANFTPDIIIDDQTLLLDGGSYFTYTQSWSGVSEPGLGLYDNTSTISLNATIDVGLNLTFAGQFYLLISSCESRLTAFLICRRIGYDLWLLFLPTRLHFMPIQRYSRYQSFSSSLSAILRDSLPRVRFLQWLSCFTTRLWI